MTRDLRNAWIREQRLTPKPNYKIVCISLYIEDIENLEFLVAQAKASGHSRANKSAIIRYALSSVNLSTMPKDPRTAKAADDS